MNPAIIKNMFEKLNKVMGKDNRIIFQGEKQIVYTDSYMAGILSKEYLEKYRPEGVYEAESHSGCKTISEIAERKSENIIKCNFSDNHRAKLKLLSKMKGSLFITQNEKWEISQQENEGITTVLDLRGVVDLSGVKNLNYKEISLNVRMFAAIADILIEFELHLPQGMQSAVVFKPIAGYDTYDHVSFILMPLAAREESNQ